MTITLALASPLSGSLYRPDSLDEEDARRAAQFPSKHFNADWRSSRVLKSRFLPDTEPPPFSSLSHTHGYAALAYATPALSPVSVDIELIKNRNFHRLLDLVVTKEEMTWWERQGRTAEAFYRLWTLKEALLKNPATGNDADLNTAGLYPKENNLWFAGTGSKQQFSARWYVLDNVCMLCVVWAGNPKATVCPQFFGFDSPVSFAEHGFLSGSISESVTY